MVAVNTWSAVDVTIDYTEISTTEDPTVSINGYEATHQGMLADGETTSLNVSTDWLANGTNVVEVQVSENLSADAPTARVGVDYYREAVTSHSSTYNATAWTEERTINKTFVDGRESATLPFPFQTSVLDI